jgi:Flp pilus assembly secretin CpaC
MNIAPMPSRASVASRIQRLATIGLVLALAGCAGPRADKKPSPVTTTVAKPGARQTITVRTWFIEVKTGTPAARALVDELEDKTGMKKIGGNAGLLAASEAKVIWAKLKTLGQTDILSAPTVTVASGNQANISIGEQMRYPARWELDAKKNAWTPLDFETRVVGVEAEVEPELLEDGRIRLKLRATATELDGFVRTDKPTSPPPAAPTDVITFEGKPLETDGPVTPVFSVRNVKTQISLRPGETLVLQGSRQTMPAGAPSTTKAGEAAASDADAAAPRASFIFVTAGQDMPPGVRSAP